MSGRCISNDSGIQADGTYDLFYADIKRFGRVFNTEDTAAAAVNELRERVAAVERSVAQTPSRTAVAVIFFEGTIGSYGNQATVDTQMASLGLRNIFGDQDERYFEPNVEELIARDPDVLIIVNLDETAAEARREVMSRPRLAGLRAVREGRVASLQFGLITESPLAVEGLEQLAGQLRS